MVGNHVALSPSELETMQCRLDLALDVVPLIDTVVEGHEDRSVVISDIVNCWLQLDPVVREQYERSGPASGLTEFGGDYIEEVDRSWQEYIGVKPFDFHESIAERLCYARWQTHVAQVRERMTAGLPPEPEWLARFPVPSET